MLIDGVHYTSVAYIPPAGGESAALRIIDQRYLPFRLVFKTLSTVAEVITAIRDMQVRGAPLIGITAAFGLVFAFDGSPANGLDSYIAERAAEILAARPTASNTEHCLNRVLQAIRSQDDPGAKKKTALLTALQLMEEDKEICRAIGEQGFSIVRELTSRKALRSGKSKSDSGTLNILTHCNAGWLACVDFGTVTSVIYYARKMGIDLHVWVDETRPKNQGARLTVWELSQNGIKNSLITDNAGGYLMQKGLVDLVLVGCDRVTKDGDVANKIGTYLKALAAHDNNIPFYVALPSTTIDWVTENGLQNIPIENRDGSEVRYVEGWCDDQIKSVLITEPDVNVVNPGFDVTPAKYVTGLITEKGICRADRESIRKLFPLNSVR